MTNAGRQRAGGRAGVSAHHEFSCSSSPLSALLTMFMYFVAVRRPRTGWLSAVTSSEER